MLNGCAAPKVEQYEEMQPTMRIEEYFNGPIKAWGLVENWRGKIVSRFEVDMVGTWDGNVGTLEEEFVYYDEDKKDHRTWTIRKLADNRYQGAAGDIIGIAEGKVSGSAATWKYVMELPVNDTVYELHFDDRMWLMNDGVLINRTYMKKFGITVAELTIFMQKQEK